MTNVQERLEKHYKRAVEHYGQEAVLGVFLYGSWNYGTNLLDSDVDTKCILIPDLYSLAIHPYEVKHLHVDDEVCECMSIMHMVANWKKQNLNFVEIMFTDYCIINPAYEEKWCRCLTDIDREEVARYDLKAAVLSMSHQAIHTIKQDPTDLKKIMNATRIMHTLKRLLSEPDSSYKDIIRVPEYIAQIRTCGQPAGEGYVVSLLEYFENTIAMAEDMEVDKSYQQALDTFLEMLILELIEYRLEVIG